MVRRFYARGAGGGIGGTGTDQLRFQRCRLGGIGAVVDGPGHRRVQKIRAATSNRSSLPAASTPVAVVAGEVPFALMSAGVMVRRRSGERIVMVAALSNYLNQVRAVAPDYIADALDHYNRDLDDRPFPRAEGVKIALELTAQ